MVVVETQIFSFYIHLQLTNENIVKLSENNCGRHHMNYSCLVLPHQCHSVRLIFMHEVSIKHIRSRFSIFPLLSNSLKEKKIQNGKDNVYITETFRRRTSFNNNSLLCPIG